MGLQSPPNMLGFLICAVTAVMAVIAVGLSGFVCNNHGLNWCGLQVPTQPAAAAGVGIAAASLGIVASGLAMAWYLVTELWDVGILRFVLVVCWAIVAVLALVAGIIYAYALNLPDGNFTFAYFFPTAVAACVWQWFLLLLSLVSAFFCFKAGGGGTATLPVSS